MPDATLLPACSPAIVDAPSPWVTRFAPLIPRGGEVLDLACGNGRHTRLLAALGHQVVAVDRDAEALAKLASPGIIPMQLDLEARGFRWPFAANRFSAIVVTNYLHRPLFPLILASLALNGVLIYETFARGNELLGKPSNPNFLLTPTELLGLAHSHFPQPLRVVAYEDGIVSLPRQAMVQRICAMNALSVSADSCFRLS